MLSRTSVRHYVDDDELERAAGNLEIKAKDDRRFARELRGAATALRVLASYDVHDADEFALLFERTMWPR